MASTLPRFAKRALIRRRTLGGEVSASPEHSGSVMGDLEDAIAVVVDEIRPQANAPLTDEQFRAAVQAQLRRAVKPTNANWVFASSKPSLTEVVVNLEGNAMNKALERSTYVFTKALSAAGLPGPVLPLLQSWFTVQLQARELHRQASVQSAMAFLLAEKEDLAGKATEKAIADNPMRGVSASELGAMLGLTDESVRVREHRGEMFSILPAGRKRGREYPVFQAWPGIVGAPLQEVLKALAGLDSTDFHGFFAGVTDLLGGITPVEALMGKPVNNRTLDDEAHRLLDAPLQDRLHAVVTAARALVAQRSA